MVCYIISYIARTRTSYTQYAQHEMLLQKSYFSTLQTAAFILSLAIVVLEIMKKLIALIDDCVINS